MTCVLCAAPLAAAPVVGATGRHEASFTSVACHRCGLVQHGVMPFPEALALYYATAYRREFPFTPITIDGEVHPYGSPEWERRIDDGSRRMAAQIASVLALPAGARTLEIGCGEGRLAAAFAALGFAAHGDESDPEMMRQAEERGVLRATPREVLATYDAVMSVHNLEHLPDPVGALIEWRKHLAHRGKVWIEVPNLDHPYGDLDRWYWQWPHLTCFTPSTLLVALVRAGFDDISVAVQQQHPAVIYAWATNLDRKPMDFDTALVRCKEAHDRGQHDQPWSLRDGAATAAWLDGYRERARTDPRERVNQWLAMTGAEDDFVRDEVRRLRGTLEFTRQSIGSIVEQCEEFATSDAYHADPWCAGYASGDRVRAGRVGVALSHLSNNLTLRGAR